MLLDNAFPKCGTWGQSSWSSESVSQFHRFAFDSFDIVWRLGSCLLAWLDLLAGFVMICLGIQAPGIKNEVQVIKSYQKSSKVQVLLEMSSGSLPSCFWMLLPLWLQSGLSSFRAVRNACAPQLTFSGSLSSFIHSFGICCWSYHYPVSLVVTLWVPCCWRLKNRARASGRTCQNSCGEHCFEMEACSSKRCFNHTHTHTLLVAWCSEFHMEMQLIEM